jgi:predicted porin
MKKPLILFLSLMLVLGVASYVFATDVTIGGEITVRGEFNTNTTDFDDDVVDRNAFYDQHLSISADAQVTDSTKGFIELTVEENDVYGQAVDRIMWATGTSAATGLYANGNRIGDTLNIRQAYILHQGSGLLGYNAGIQVGRILPKLGNGLFLDHTEFGDDAIVLFADPTDQLHVGLVHLKMSEGTAAANDDANTYTLLFNLKGDGFNAGGDVTYLDDQNAAPDGLHFWNFGLRCDSAVSGFNIKADIELQTGKAKNPAGDIKYRGWALLLGADYALANATVNAEFAYGSGDKIDSTDKIEAFVTSLGADQQHYTYVYEDRACSAASATCTRATGLTNTWYIKVGADAEVNPDLTVGADLYYLQAAKKLSNTYDDKDIGWELDANLSYKIDKNLAYFVQAGYLWADDLFKNFTAGEEPDNSYVVRHGLTLTF